MKASTGRRWDAEVGEGETRSVHESAARWSFTVALVLSPFRARLVLVDRFDPPIYRDFTSFLVFWSELAVLATIGFWLFSLYRRPRPLSFGPPFMSAAAFLLLGLAWLSTVTSADYELSLYTSLRLSVYALLAVFVINEIRDISALRPAAVGMLVLQVLVVVPQALSGGFVGLGWLGEHGLDPSDVATSRVDAADGDTIVRVYGLADHPNILGGVLGFGVIILIASLAGARPAERIAGLGLVVSGALAIALTFSRGAVLALALSYALGVWLLVWQGRRGELRWWLAVGGAFAFLLSVMAAAYGKFLSARYDLRSFDVIDLEQRSFEARWILIKTAIDLMERDPLLGTGVGATTVAMRDAYVGYPYDFQPVHVALLAAGAEVGVLGAIAYAVLVLGPWVLTFASRRSIDPSLSGATCLLSAVTIVGFFDYYTWSYPAGQIWFWVSLGLWGGAYERSRSLGSRSTEKRDRAPRSR